MVFSACIRKGDFKLFEVTTQLKKFKQEQQNKHKENRRN